MGKIQKYQLQIGTNLHWKLSQSGMIRMIFISHKKYGYNLSMLVARY